MLSLSMFVRPKMGYVRGKIGLTRQFDRCQPGNYLQPCDVCIWRFSLADKDLLPLTAARCSASMWEVVWSTLRWNDSIPPQVSSIDWQHPLHGEEVDSRGVGGLLGDQSSNLLHLRSPLIRKVEINGSRKISQIKRQATKFAHSFCLNFVM